MGQVGRYQILEELGRGAHGVVYKALDPAIGRTIAIKAIALDNIAVADRDAVRDGILREARLAGTLSHPNIVTVYDVLDDGNAAYIFMEFVDGRSLEQAISDVKEHKPGKLSRASFLSVFRQVAQALDYAHRKGVIHRDIKPANIVLTDQQSEPLAKIADFGVAKFASHDVTQQLGGPRTLVGTPSYMSPEQVSGAPVSGASDQFSMAVIAYEVLCGRKAFFADTIEALLYRIRHEPEEPAHIVNTALSTTVTKVLQRALAKEPAERFNNCSELAGALEFALGDSPNWEPGIVGGPITPPAPEFPKYEIAEEENTWIRKLALMAFLGMAVGLAIVLIVRMNSGAAIVTQVLDTKSGLVSPPPAVEELQYDRRPTSPPLDLSQTTPKASPEPKPVSRPKLEKRPPVAQLIKPAASFGEVQLLTDPPGASVRVDGMSSCTTPCSLTLASGRHTLAANMDGYAIARKIFYIPADTSLFLPLPKSEGVLLVSSEPSGASVNIDGKSAGSTPITLHLVPGSHRVSVWDGSRWRSETVQVSSDEVHTRTFRF